MTRSKLYVIPGDPTPLARARINFKARRVYDSQQHIKLITGISIREQHNNEPYFEGAISLSATFYMPMPSSWTLKKKNAMAGKFMISAPDTSNMLKFIEDCCTSITYHDDCTIVCLEKIMKIYDFNPRTEFTISEIK